jgi:hypothetical protein
MMPPVLREFLSNLTPAEATAMWEYLDGGPAFDEMIEIVAPLSPDFLRPGENRGDR